MFKLSKVKCFFATLIFSMHANAITLPTAKSSSAADDGDYLGLVKELAKEGIELIVPIIGALLLIAGAWSLLKSYNQVQDKQATWGDFGKVGIGAMFSCVVGIILLNQAMNIF
ncbi:TIGR03745 family integrating conjugative element membrane protein [Enterovibrio norvegicus]|uniref:TIGR03745 family integrating conjugative element membrane protein n=1 Tax=Enterovibrio norvegicus TaxID=188144 RepID=UPI000C81B851|nr:TIGR03745 family integrating conjugative element membrane protein [Enterovibrio norvegicus]PMH64433.1 integrating conjugative element membrane protein [Enterovibrio norvegicus]